MQQEDLASLVRRDRLRIALGALVLFVALLWVSIHFLQPAPPSRIVLATGSPSGEYHRIAQRYIKLLARDGIKVEEVITEGAAENLALLKAPDSRVDVAFLQGGVADASTDADADSDLVMIASLYYEPVWVFHRLAVPPAEINELRGKRIASGTPGSGTAYLVIRLLAANGINRENTSIINTGGVDALAALKAGTIDAAIFVGGAMTPFIQEALHNPSIHLMSLARADAYTRRLPYLTKLSLPMGTVDLANNIPDRDITLVGTRAMLVAREGFHPAIVNLLVDAAREIHGGQGYFEPAGEFPGMTQVDIPVSEQAVRHYRFGPSLLHRYLPFAAATFIERAIIFLVPLVVILVPLLNFLPQFLRWRIRSRIFRWYGEISLLERDVVTRKGELPLQKWLADLDRIELAVEGIKIPTSFASEAYTLREHIALVRRAVLAKAGGAVGA